MKSNSQQVKVFLRCRPPLKRELSSGQYRSVVSCNVERPNSVNIRVERDGQTFIKTFDFDGVFNQTANQLDVYKRVAVHSIEEMLKGYDCTIFAYGQTGTGKTYTMEGRPSRETKWDVNSDAGLIPRVCQHLFEELENIDSEYSVQISYVELYNEKLRDLLSPHYSELKLLNDSKGNVIIEGVEEVVVHSNENVYDCLDGCWKRKTASTKMNENSSRSHTVFTITTHVKSRNSGEEDILITGKLHLVDLAGSENIGRSGATNMRAQEAGKINKSLLTLGRVITALVEKTGRVPYRDSLLTRILQNSLGGKAKTNIIATISPAHINLEETLSTCIYASRAKFIENQPEVNQTLTKKALIKEYTMIIERLRKDLYTTRSKNGIYLSEERYEEIMGQLAQKDHESSTLSISVSSLQEKCDELTNANSSLRTELRETLKELKQGNKRNEELSEKLLASQKELNVSNIKINEKEYIITVQEETERKLREETKALRNIMDLLKNDQQIVYSACEELANHHRKQIAVIRRVEDCLYRNASSLEDSLKNFQGQSESFFSQLLDELNINFSLPFKNFTEVVKREVETFKELSENLNHQTIEKARTNSDAQLAQVGALKSLSHAQKVEAVFNDRTLQELFGKLKDELLKIIENIEAKRTLLFSRLDQCLHEMDSLNNIQTNSSSELYRKLDDLLSIQTTTISTVKQYLSNQVLDRTQHREAVKAELLEKLRGVLDSYFSAEQQGDEKFATYMKSNFQLVENSIENISNNLLANIQMDANNLSKHMISYSDALKNIQSENESRSSQLSVDATLAVDYVDSAKSTSEQREKKVSDIIGSYKKLVETKADEFISSEKSFISELTTSLDNHDTDSKFLLGQFLEKLSFEKEGINEKLSFISEAIQLRNNSASHEYQELNNTRNKLVAHVDQLHNETGEHVVSYPSCEGVPLPDETPALWSSEERKEKLKLLQNLLKSEETDNIQHFQELKEPTTFENDENVEFIALSSKRKKTNNDTALNNEEKPTLERVSQRNRTPLLEKS